MAWRDPMMQRNGAPMGFGQQSGSSVFLDRSGVSGRPNPVTAVLEDDDAWGGYTPPPVSPWANAQTSGEREQEGGYEATPPPQAPPQAPRPAPPAASSWQTRTPEELAREQAIWDAEFRALPPGGSMNRQRPGTEGSADPRIATPESGYGPGGTSNPDYTTPPPAGPGTTPTSTSPGYTGGPLAKWGTGNIPGAENIAGGSHASTGVNTGGWGTQERGTNSIKNTAMKIATRYPPKPSSLDAVIADADFKQFFPNAKKVGFDKIDFGDGRPVDVIVNADPNSDTGTAWAFQTEDGPAPSSTGTPGAPGPSASPGTIDSALAPEGAPTPASVAGGAGLSGTTAAQILAELLAESRQPRGYGRSERF